MRTPIGEALMVTDQAGRLRAFDWTDCQPRLAGLMRRHYSAVTPAEGRAPNVVRSAFEQYFAGELWALAGLDCATGGSAFSKAVWSALREIPVGETWSYGALAARVGRPRAMRAVGRANGANPLGLVTPCHRVIGANGALTGYAGGLVRKLWLLRHEGAWVN